MKRFFSKALSIMLVAALLSGMGMGLIPSSRAHAAAPGTDLLASITLKTGENVKVSSENTNRKAPLAASHDGSSYWQYGGSAANIFPTAGNTASLWVAVDLGSAQAVNEFRFDIPTSFSNVQKRMSGYEVLYSTSEEAWTNLPATNNSSASVLDWSSNAWALAKHVAVPAAVTPDDPNWGASLTPGTSAWTATSTGPLSAPVSARYVLIHFTLISGSPGTLGASGLTVLSAAGSVVSPAVIPVSASYEKGSGSTVTANLQLQGDTLAGIKAGPTVAEAVYLVMGQDYSLSAPSGGIQQVVLATGYLESLPQGTTTLGFQFTGGTIVPFELNVTSPLYSDVYMNDYGSGYALIEPSYPGMSLTVGRPAVVDAHASSGKFPIFRIVKALPGTTITGTLYGPGGAAAYSFPAVNADTQTELTVPDTVALANGTYKVSFTLTNQGGALYDTFYFTAIDRFDLYKSVTHPLHSGNANVANVSPDSWANEAYPALQLDDAGRIAYVPDYKGNRIMDYSDVGYKGGGTAIPNVPVRAKVAPLADNTQDAWQSIQDAIDYVSMYPIQEDGFRGAVYLEPGVFRISKPLTIAVSGVVLRGAGAGTPTPVVGDGSAANPYNQQIANEEEEPDTTKLIATWTLSPSYTPPANHSATGGSPYDKSMKGTMIYITGPKASTPANVTVEITDQYVGAGQNFVHVARTDDFFVGDVVSVRKAVNTNWVKAMYMDKIDGASSWLTNGTLESGFAGIPFSAERTIIAIDAATGTITFAEPLSDNLDRRWGVSTLAKSPEDNRINHVGVENIQGISHFYNTDSKPALQKYGSHYLSYNDENHAQVFVAMVNVRDGWMRNFVTYQIDSAFVTDGSSRNITVQDGYVLDPVSLMDAGERRYSIYYRKSQFMFTQRVHARYMRHAFIVDSYTSGPNVFYDSSSEYTSNASEPHFRWSSGGLYDSTTARFYLQNRWNMGTSHGWAGVNYLIYNSTGPFMVTQPQLTPNYIMGQWFDSATNRLGSATNPETGRQKTDKGTSENMTAAKMNGGMVPNFEAYEYGINKKLSPQGDRLPESLYVQQLVNSHGAKAAAVIKENTVPPIIDRSSSYKPKLRDLQVEGQTLPGFSPEVSGYSYHLPLDYDYSKPPVITAVAEPGIAVDIAYPQHNSSEPVLITLTDATGVKNFYKVSFASTPKSPIVLASDQQVDASNQNYAVNVLNPNDYAGPTSVRWAASGAVWIRMYLGEKEQTLHGVQVGFTQHATSPRTYKLRIEYSADGQNWSFVPSGTVTGGGGESAPVEWTTDGQTYYNALTLNPGSASAAENTLQTFTFDEPVKARFIRIAGNGNTTGTGNNAWSVYWRLRPLLTGGISSYAPPEAVAITGPASVIAGSAVGLQAQVTPEAALVKEVIWSSSNPSVASVDSKGNVTGHAAGDAVITATTVDGRFAAPGLLEQAAASHPIKVQAGVIEEPNEDNTGSPGSGPAMGGGQPVQTGSSSTKTLAAGQAGEVSLNGLVIVSVPSQAAAGEITLTVEQVKADLIPVLPAGSALGGGVYEVLKQGSSALTKPFALTVQFDPAKIPAGHKTALFYYDEAANAWVELKDSKVEGNTMTASTDRFGKYAVMAIQEKSGLPGTPVSFPDVSGHWAEAVIKQAAGSGILEGYPDGSFQPDRAVTRAEFAAILVKALQLPDADAAAVSFADEAAIGEWAKKPIGQAQRLGIVSGYEDGTFRPQAEVTRAEMAVMAARALGLDAAGNGAGSGFADDGQIPAWAKGAAAALKEAGLAQGKEGGAYAPADSTTRAEAVTLLLRMAAYKKQ
ncbi:S-layer homology domain-containing protein [Paenibacillus mesotrionivorans]|uniref:S-layer homology domain-containing protein n=1 Tax=Paenibacillus mesotrionivorans TaxID=3160968 RepID=A0ACC7P6H2_9BACL